jgi:acetylornithine deacetylase
MKGACAAAVEALTAIREAGVVLRRNVTVALVVGEEQTGDGADALPASVRAPVTVVGEPTDLVPCSRHSGYLECVLTTSGTRAHAALPEIGANAAQAMLFWVTRLLDRAADPTRSERIAINLRQISGGSPNFVVAEECEAYLDIHVTPDTGQEEVSRLIDTSLCEAQQVHPGCRFEFEHVSWAEGYALDTADPRLEPVRQACADAGVTLGDEIFRSHSDANLIRSRGSLPLVLGPGDLSVAHTSDEHVRVSDLTEASRIYAALIYRCCV